MAQKSRRAWQKRSVCTHDPSFSSTAFKGHPDGSVGKRNRLQCRRRWFYSWVEKTCWRRDGLPTLYSWASLVAQMIKNLPAIREPWVRSWGWEDPPGEGKGYPLQYSGLKNSMDCIVHGVAESWTRLSNFHFLCLQSISLTLLNHCSVLPLDAEPGF